MKRLLKGFKTKYHYCILSTYHYIVEAVDRE